MPQNITLLTVFVSGPSDVVAEKEALRTVITEISERLTRTHGVQLRVVGWPNDVRPGVNVDLQAEINSQLGTDCDIYLGILGTRFGTPTGNAGSGTEEEFEQGLERLRSNSSSLRVLFYFKTGMVDPHNLEINQFQKVKVFRAGLHPRGVLYRDFKTTDDFVQLVQKHLDKLVSDEWRNGQWVPISGFDETSPRQVTATPSSQDSHSEDAPGATNAFVDSSDDGDEEDLGLLDYMASFHEETIATTQTLKQISENTARIGEEIHERAAEIHDLQRQHEEGKDVGGSRAQQEFISNARGVVDLAAQNLDNFVQGMAPSIEDYRTHSRAMFAHLRNGLHAHSELGNAPDKDSQQALETIISGLESALGSITGFQDSINSVLALTGKFKRAKKRVATILGKFIAEMSLTLDEARRTLDSLSETADLP